MKTAREALKEHRATFWQAKDCNAWMATESQLIAQMMRQEGNGGTAAAIGHDAYARQIMGIE